MLEMTAEWHWKLKWQRVLVMDYTVPEYSALWAVIEKCEPKTLEIFKVTKFGQAKVKVKAHLPSFIRVVLMNQSHCKFSLVNQSFISSIT